jgi:hypothetical protein
MAKILHPCNAYEIERAKDLVARFPNEGNIPSEHAILLTPHRYLSLLESEREHYAQSKV